MRLLAVDPGVNYAGLAKFDDSLLYEAVAKKGPGFKDDLRAVAQSTIGCAQFCEVPHEIAMEWPQIYGGRRAGGKKDPNSMLPLAAFNGALAARYTGVPIKIYKPHDWKGSKAKNPMARVILSRLTKQECNSIVLGLMPFVAALEAAELKGVECKHPFMNAIDAIGIGLHHLGRLKVGGPVRRRVVHRE